ncbi:MAG: hypothetical protein WD341_06160 [Tistlia sp.]|uniref:hypothetical protein n=1 Tax=Tistlia sp. TaxID=3057121 RepID=UPI0034A589E3
MTPKWWPSAQGWAGAGIGAVAGIALALAALWSPAPKAWELAKEAGLLQAGATVMLGAAFTFLGIFVTVTVLRQQLDRESRDRQAAALQNQSALLRLLRYEIGRAMFDLRRAASAVNVVRIRVGIAGEKSTPHAMALGSVARSAGPAVGKTRWTTLSAEQMAELPAEIASSHSYLMALWEPCDADTAENDPAAFLEGFRDYIEQLVAEQEAVLAALMSAPTQEEASDSAGLAALVAAIPPGVSFWGLSGLPVAPPSDHWPDPPNSDP